VGLCPEDVLHLFPDGLLRSELAWLLYIFFGMGLKLSALNEATRAYRNFPPDVRIPKFHEKLKKGVAGKLPDSSRTVRMTGAQMMHFAMHRCASFRAPSLLLVSLTQCLYACAMCSVKVIDPLLTDAMRRHPAWLSWLKLVELFMVVVQHSLRVEDIQLIDDLQCEHSRLFDCVPEYNGLKRPKHHFMSHLPWDVWRYGPPRGYWCFGFEGFNRVIKHGARRSNWKDATMSIMLYWSCRSARSLV